MELQEIISGLDSEHYLIDTHCHLDMTAYSKDLDDILLRAKQNHVNKIVTIGIDTKSSLQAVQLAQSFPQIFATIGVHPHDVENIAFAGYTQFQDLYIAGEKNIVGYGEIGLDYVKKYSSPKMQRDHFRYQLGLADELELPIIVHNREADEDTYDILSKSTPLKKGGIMHCFSGNLQFAKKIIDLGMLISIPGIVTFKNAKTLQEVAREIPLSSMVIETDGPFLAPHPFRGKRNEPSYVAYTAAKISELRSIPVSEVAKITSSNAENLFQLTK